MRCPSESDLQAFADGESAGSLSEHLRECPGCRNRVDEMRHDAAQLVSVMTSVEACRSPRAHACVTRLR